jgi:hypothetical protein
MPLAYQGNESIPQQRMIRSREGQFGSSFSEEVGTGSSFSSKEASGFVHRSSPSFEHGVSAPTTIAEVARMATAMIINNFDNFILDILDVFIIIDSTF